MKRDFRWILLVFLFICGNSYSAAAQRKVVSAKEVTGTFDSRYGNWQILALGNGKLKVSFSGIYEYKLPNGEMMANMGEADGTAFIKGDTATFQPDQMTQCTITIKFVRAGRISVTQNGSSSDCGFGLNVSSAGSYKKTSSAKPKFSE